MKRNKKYSSPSIITNKSGLTLVELMIAVALSGFVIAAIYMTFKAQQRAATSQNKVAETQQTLRASLQLISSELRIAGYNPNHKTMDSINDANSTKISFRYWDDTNNEIDLISYSFDGANKTLTRWVDNGDDDTSTNYQVVAENIEDVDFYYTMTSSPPTYTPAPLTDIRSITVSIIARSNIEDSNYTNNNQYYSANGTIINYGGDGFRRRQLITTVNCRNMGLN